MASYKRHSWESLPSRFADRLGAGIVARKTPAERKAGGLYLTPVEVADFIAGQANTSASEIRILDPAAGSGTLLCAIVEGLAIAEPRVRKVELTAYETDPDLQEALASVLDRLKRWAEEHQVEVSVRIEKQDFVLAHAGSFRSNGHLFDTQSRECFDLVIANPPYFKISKDDPRAQAAMVVVHGQPNIYALFMAATAALLRKGGEFLFITPRSFASGPYFRLFREKFFANIRPVGVHVFGSRREAFGRDEVLQESIILRGVRDDGWQHSREGFELEITGSAGIADLAHLNRRSLPLRDALDMASSSKIFRLPILPGEDAALRLVDSWTGSLHQYEMNISTGPVVPFRATEYIDKIGVPSNDYAPLIWMNHVLAMQVTFPIETRKPQYISTVATEKSLLLPNRNYVLIRRFSAKEEARRLVAAPWLKGSVPGSLLGIENHLNYIYSMRDEMNENEALGLAALLNSELLDTYFRVSSGNTQVSATELRAMPLPPRDMIIFIGQRVRKQSGGESLDDIVKEAIGTAR
ncbi:MAG: N-6 DNA methylase [Candidatus Binatus sp.]|uniref:Eco57I restriction-modification methylase domain-containing protein n=1 Tax=Candidatus Binatus sp. TaxID=2811406 RepID=UPI003C77B730